jgi:Protein of unknown function (DUF1579)
MQVASQVQHQWLDRFLGEWSSECNCQMGADQPPETIQGTEIGRSVGGLWMVTEESGNALDCTPSTTIMTLGFDPERDRFVGTFVCSMMPHLWQYEGRLDAAGNVLTLDTEGPNFNQTAMAKYQDIIEFVSDDHRIMTSKILSEDGQWSQFMTAHYHRRK